MIIIGNQVYDGVSMKPPIDDVLEHYGVKGMKWRHHLRGGFVKLTRKKVSQGLGVNDAIKEKTARSSKLVKSGNTTYRTNENRGTMRKASDILKSYQSTYKGKTQKLASEIKQARMKKEKQKEQKEKINKKKKANLYKLW